MNTASSASTGGALVHKPSSSLRRFAPLLRREHWPPCAFPDICEDVVEFYDEHVRPFVEENRAWTRKSVEEHILRTETNMDVAMELDKRSVCQILQRLRERMVEENTEELHMPNVSTYLKFSQHLQKLCGARPSGSR